MFDTDGDGTFDRIVESAADSQHLATPIIVWPHRNPVGPYQ
jgi:hypothetical protein